MRLGAWDFVGIVVSLKPFILYLGCLILTGCSLIEPPNEGT